MNIGESQAPITPDLVSPQAKQELFGKLARATVEKQHLDAMFQAVAGQKGEFTSRIKNPKTTVQKIVQKRLQGRDYGIESINDAYGGRIAVERESQIPEMVKRVEALGKAGVLNITKKQQVKTDYHKAFHIDFETQGGTKGEVQILTHQELANSVVNHDLRAKYGEDMSGAPKQLADKQAEIAKSLPSDKAQALSQTVTQLTKNGPVPPQVTAQLLANQSQSV